MTIISTTVGQESLRRNGVALIVNKAEIDVFLELSCFFNDPADNSMNLTQMTIISTTVGKSPLEDVE